MGKRLIKFLDTTLRDGEQAPDNSMSPEQKLSLALKLEETGVDFIETGFPASSKFDFDATQLISAELTKANHATFSRARIDDLKKAFTAGGTSNRHTLLIAATGSDLHLRNKRQITREQAITEVEECIRFARENSDCRVAVGIEDASRGEFNFIGQMTQRAVEAGVHQMILCDTTGHAIPTEFAKLVAFTKQCSGNEISIATHCHNDLGLAVANTLAGIEVGADEVQVTLGGIGERAGNASFEEVAAALHLKSEQFNAYTNINLNALYPAYNELRKQIRLELPRTKPIFGQYAFSTAAGIHQQGLLSDPETYEFVKPHLFNRDREFFVARHSGRSIIRYLLNDMNIEVDESTVAQLYDSIIEGSANASCLSMNTVREQLKSSLTSKICI